MSVTAAVLLIISAVTHAGWNLIGKRFHSTAASFLLASAIGVVILVPFPLIFTEVVSSFPPVVWLLLGLTGLFQAVYYISLAAAYRRGDMSLIYPLARSLPAIFVAIFAVIIGRADRISAQAFGGIFLIVAGGFFLPMKHFRDFAFRKYFNIAFALALLAALGTTGYSLADDGALRSAWAGIGEDTASWKVSAVYACFEGVSSVLWMAAYVLIHPGERQGFAGLKGVRSAALMGVGIYLTYTIVLVSMAFVDDVSYVVAFRQLSIPIGVVMGIIFLREKLYMPKAAGALIMFVGLVFVGTG